MPPLIVGASFDILPNNPYELADKAMENEGHPWPPPDKIKELSRLIVNSGSLLFVRFQNSIFSHSDVDHHLLVGSVHRDVDWIDFLYFMTWFVNATCWDGLTTILAV